MAHETILIGAIIFLASFLHGMFGFAFVLIALPLLSFFLSIKIAVPLLSLCLALLSGILSFQLKRKFDYKGIMPLLIGAVFGIPIGIFFLIEFSDKILKMLLGIILIIYSSYSLLFNRIPFRLSRWTGYIFGLLGGSMGGAFNIPAPPVLFYISTQEWTKTDTVGSLNLFFFITSVIVVAFHAIFGNLTRGITVTFIGLIPVVIIGVLIGTYFFKKMSEANYRRGLFALLIIMGIMLLI